MGGKSTSTSTPRLNHIAVQSATYGTPLSVGWGTYRVAANLVWYGDFVSKSQKTSQGGKGGGSNSSTTYSYSAAVVMALGEGPIVGIRKVYKDSQVLVSGGTTALAQAGLNLNTGANGQATWGYLTTKHSTQAIGYSYTPIVYASGYALNSSATLANHSFEVQSGFRAVVSGSTIDDANASDIVSDFLTNSIYGVPLWGAGLLGSLTAYATYCTAAGLFLSPVLESTRSAADFLTEILDATNSEAVWSGGVLNIVPYGDTAITNNGVTYTPSLTPVYSLTNDDFIVASDGEDPVKVQLQKQADSYNAVQIEFKDRTINYNTNMSAALDQGNINQYGLRREDPHTLNCICDAAVAARVAQLRVQRTANLRRTFSFELDQRYCLLDPMDLVTITSGDLNLVLVRITEISEAADGQLSITAEEMLVGSGHAVEYARQAFQGYQPDTSVAPGSVTNPVLINPPHSLTNNDTQIWLAVSGGVNWGGCQVYVSLDNTLFEYKGVIGAPARYGVLTSALAVGSDPDTTHSFGVNLTPSLGTLTTSTSVAADAGASMCLIDNELLSYQTATLTTANNYTVGTYLRRGQLGSTIAAHSIGAPFARLDDGIFKYSFNASQAGKTIYFKFVSFNVYGAGFENLAAVSTYSAVLSTTSSGSAWTSLTGVPANVAALTGSEAIQNSILQGLLTGGSVVPSQSGSITGQGTLATQSQATWASQVTGTGKPQDNATFSTVFRQTTAPSSPTLNDIWVLTNVGGTALAVYAWTGSTWILGGDPTSINTAAAISGQTAWATYGTLTPTQLVNKPVNLLINPTGALGMQNWGYTGAAFSTTYGVYGEGFYFYCNTGSNTSGVSLSQDVVVYPGTTVSLSGLCFSGGVSITSGTPLARCYIAWLNAARTAVVAYSAVYNQTPVGAWLPFSVANQVCPAGAAYARIVFDISGGTWTNSSFAVRSVKLEPNSVCTPYSDDSTYGAAYQNGALIDTLQPAQAGADVTSSHSSSGFAGQGALATLGSVDTERGVECGHDKSDAQP